MKFTPTCYSFCLEKTFRYGKTARSLYWIVDWQWISFFEKLHEDLIKATSIINRHVDVFYIKYFIIFTGAAQRQRSIAEGITYQILRTPYYHFGRISHEDR